jgi:hypothetical protein
VAESVATVTSASSLASNGWLLIALPALGAAILLLLGRRANAWGHLLGCAALLASFGYGLALFLDTAGQDPARRVQEVSLFEWIPVNALQVDFGLRIDPLSLVFVLLITGVGSLIHIYSIGYLAHSPADVFLPGQTEDQKRATERNERRRFFAYLNLFVAAMLILVLGSSFVTLYLGWEGVGLASYLLIAFWQQRPAAATAAKKAFLMNRVGDLGLALAIFLMFNQLGTTQYAEVFARASEFSGPEILAITLLLLLGACGKSGQFPRQAGLPGVGAHPRRDHGHGRGVPDRAFGAAVRPERGRQTGRHRHRRDHSSDRVCDRLRLRRLQEGARVLHRLPDRIHDPRGRSRAVRLRAGHHAPVDPRLLQGRALPGGGLGHARDERRG